MTNEQIEAVAVTQADIRYLVKLADWAAGQGFCQIEGLKDPDEWCFQMWEALGPPDGSGYSADALADRFITAAEQRGMNAASEWQPIETAPRDQMFIWAMPKLDGQWGLGLAYRNVSGGWSDAYGAATKGATHWTPLPAPPAIATMEPGA